MREVDRLMVDEYGIVLLQMMENAGRALARVARDRFVGDGASGRVVVLAGPGGNGGGGLVCARRMHNWGWRVEVVLSAPRGKFRGVPLQQLTALSNMGVPIRGPSGFPGESEEPCGLIVDALIGYSLRGAPRGPAAELIRRANGHAAPVLALDAPSGVDTDTGAAREPAIRADATMTLALPKVGLLAAHAADHVGELYLADISVPPGLYSRLGVDVDPRLFANCDVLRLR